jgi:hypothetical protein
LASQIFFFIAALKGTLKLNQPPASGREQDMLLLIGILAVKQFKRYWKVGRLKSLPGDHMAVKSLSIPVWVDPDFCMAFHLQVHRPVAYHRIGIQADI